MPLSTDLMAALMVSLICGDTSSLSCLECSCVALEKYASGDLYVPAFSDAPTALTFVGVTGSGARSHAEQYLHQVFHSACLGFLEELAYSSLSNSANAADLDEADAAADIPLANEPLTDVFSTGKSARLAGAVRGSIPVAVAAGVCGMSVEVVSVVMVVVVDCVDCVCAC